MSRGFVKEGDQEEPIVVPPRASLPEGRSNYVTPYGKKMLLQEKENLEAQKDRLSLVDDTERRRELSLLNGKLKLLMERITSAQIIDPKTQNTQEVRFGAKVKFKMNGIQQTFQIVGVDEANIKEKKIAFTSPIAKAIISKKTGECFEFKLGEEVRSIEILHIEY
ncbi:GreA/GreB family elongation factor [Psychroflexus tropicus]|uniref:GreA/GreB family elongation factor n=1 Tax=Psychroflexus tropicus TaxID=197345 RepID=UPI00037EFF1C|nr:GreA/GreB family elongation factor [Psychroflexus tropicus]